MSPIKLTYFPITGRVEACRLALYVGGINFEDERISFEQFKPRKESGEFPFGSLPVMTVDGEKFAQSGALLRYCGRLSNLYPQDPMASLKVDQMVDLVEELFVAIYSDFSKAGREKVAAEVIPRYVSAAEEIYAKSTGPFLLGEQMSIADLKLYVVVHGIQTGKFDHIPARCVEVFPNVNKCVDALGANKKIAEWEAAH